MKFSNPGLSVGLITFFFALIVITGCISRNTQAGNVPVAFAVVVDPTTRMDSLDIKDIEGQALFLDTNKRMVGELLVAKLQPGDSFVVMAVTANSQQTAGALSFELPVARTTKEQNTFLNARVNIKKQTDDWFEGLNANPPCKNPKVRCSDIFSSALTAAKALQRPRTARKLLVIFSDMQDNITAVNVLPPNSFDRIDLIVLYAYPLSKSPDDYEPFRLELLRIFQTANPRSVRILFPAEVGTFNLEAVISELRREK